MMHCEFYEGDPRRGDKPCGKPTKQGSAYCAEHHARCWVDPLEAKAQQKREARARAKERKKQDETINGTVRMGTAARELGIDRTALLRYARRHDLIAERLPDGTPLVHIETVRQHRQDNGLAVGETP
jgi:hypothetical protein